MRRPYFVPALHDTPLRIALGLVITVPLLGLLIVQARNLLAVVLSVAVVIVVMMHCDRQGWGPITRSVTGIVAGLIAFLALMH